MQITGLYCFKASSSFYTGGLKEDNMTTFSFESMSSSTNSQHLSILVETMLLVVKIPGSTVACLSLVVKANKLPVVSLTLSTSYLTPSFTVL